MFTVDREEVTLSSSGVVATDPVSVNADHDNGTVALYGAPRYRWRVGGTAHRLAREAREETASLLPPSGGPTQVGTTPVLAFRALLRSLEVATLEVAAL